MAWTGSNLHRQFKLIRIKAEAEDLHWCDLRGTLATMLGEAGCSEFQIAAITGHSIIKSQVAGYLKMGQNLAIEAYAKLDSMLVQQPTKYFPTAY